MDDAKQQLVDRLKSSNNILVTVSRNPSVDQLSACIGLALLLNKQGKHVAAVFSGEVPSTIDFLKPEETLERNTDSLRDFIIALDKSKADKLRYKVEDNVVRIFITPYKTSINEADLEFSQGDFNVDVLVALGVSQQEDIDEAITAHGRILHDATVASVNTAAEGGLGSINWHEPQASSLSELVTELVQAVAPDLLDEQIATALLTGIVSATDRFSNDKTSSQTMSISAVLMNAGANQQLVASKLEEPEQGHIATEPAAAPEAENPDGTIEIDHTHDPAPPAPEPPQPPLPPQEEQPPELPSPDGGLQSGTGLDGFEASLPSLPDDSTQLPVDDQPPAGPAAPAEPGAEQGSSPSALSPGSKLVTGPPVLGGTLTANSQQEELEPSTDPLSMPAAEAPLLERKPIVEVAPPTDVAASSDLASAPAPEPPLSTTPPEPPQSPVPEPPASTPANDASQPSSDLSLSELEERVKEAEAKEAQQQGSSLDEVRDEVNQALSSSADTPEPIAALNAQPLGDDLHPPEPDNPPDSSPKSPQVTDSSAPPPVPPPIPFQFGNQPQQ